MRNAGKRAMPRRERVRLLVFAALALAVLLVAVFAPCLAPYDPYAQDMGHALEAPSARHLLGTDTYGRDLLSRVILGARASVFSTLVLVLLISVVGSLLGVLCGWFGGWLDMVLMRVSDVFLAFPGLVLAIAVAGVFGGGMPGAVLALAAVSWPKYTRLARSQTLAVKLAPYMSAAAMANNTPLQMIFRHVLPNIAGPLLITAALDIGTLMMELAGLSFLNLGAQAPAAEWGAMMSRGRSMLQSSPWVILGPGVAIFLTVMIFNLLGDAVRDWLDPRGEQRG